MLTVIMLPVLLIVVAAELQAVEADKLGAAEAGQGAVVAATFPADWTLTQYHYEGCRYHVEFERRDLSKEKCQEQAEEPPLSHIHDTIKALLGDTKPNNKPFCPEGYTLWRGTCYKAFNTRKSFSKAAAACRADGGTLAMPRDAETNAFLISLYNSVRDWNAFWFGLHDQREEGRFEWVDGSALGTYSSWAPGEPNDVGRNEDCAMYSPPFKDKWNDVPCHIGIRFICQTAPERP